MRKIVLLLAIFMLPYSIFPYDRELILVNHFLQTIVDNNVAIVPEGTTLIKSIAYNEPTSRYFYNCDVEIINLHTNLYEIHKLEGTAPDTWTGSILLFDGDRLLINISYTKIEEDLYWYSYVLNSNDLMNNMKISPTNNTDNEMVNFLGTMFLVQ